MIVSFYDKDFKGLQNNASLTVDAGSYSLIKRPVEVNTLTCRCEAFTEDIQPTFLVIKDDRGGYVYGSLAGIPTLSKDNITEVTGTDLKTIFSSDILFTPASSYSTVNSYLQALFNDWNVQVNQGTIPCELVFQSYVGTLPIGGYAPSTEKRVLDVWAEMQGYLKFYNLYLDSYVDLINKKVRFTVGKTMYRNLNIRLWEYGIKDYGKWIASVSEAQGYYENDGSWTAGTRWILTSKNQITTDTANRDIYPIKRRIFTSTDSVQDADTQALTALLDAMYNENIDLPATDVTPDFETKFSIYLKRGGELYKELPCGELHYDSSGLKQFQIGYRFTGAEFI